MPLKNKQKGLPIIVKSRTSTTTTVRRPAVSFLIFLLLHIQLRAIIIVFRIEDRLQKQIHFYANSSTKKCILGAQNVTLIFSFYLLWQPNTPQPIAGSQR